MNTLNIRHYENIYNPPWQAAITSHILTLSPPLAYVGGIFSVVMPFFWICMLQQ